MNPNHNPDDAERDANQSYPTGVAKGVVIDEHGKPYTHANRAYQKIKGFKDAALEHVPRRDRLMIVLTAIIALSTVAQYRLVRTNNETTGKQVDLLIVSADRVDDAAESFSRSASGINGGVSDAVSKLNLQADVLKKSADQASRLARATEEANAHSIDFDRPWIGVSILPQDFPDGKLPSALVQIVNSGRRPAKITSTEIGSDALVSFPSHLPRANTTPSTTMLVPNAHSDTTLTISPNAVDAARLAAYQSRALTFYIWVTVEYEDVVTHKTHWTHACGEYIPATQSLKAGFFNCPEYNDAQ